MTTATGEVVDRIQIPKGTILTVGTAALQQSESIWGPDAKKFEPERWINSKNIPERANEIQGHRHLVTFIDGPRT